MVSDVGCLTLGSCFDVSFFWTTQSSIKILGEIMNSAMFGKHVYTNL